MRIQSWNIQATLGCDGRHDAQRIADILTADDPAEVICLQEVSRHFDEYGGDDQLAFFRQAFPDHIPVWGAALSYSGVGSARREFGNLTLVRRESLADYRIHPLPCPPVQQVVQMPRCAVETRVFAGDALVTILNAHLAFHDPAERLAQLRHLTMLRNQGLQRYQNGAVEKGAGAYAGLPDSPHWIVTGDLNVTPGDAVWDQLPGRWQDAHVALYPDEPHPATCGIHDATQWPEGPHCRDFFLVTESLLPGLQGLTVNSDTDASDHQPICLDLTFA